MSEDFSDFEDDEVVDIKSLVKKGEEAVELQQAIEALDEERKTLSARLNELCEKEIPRELNELGLSALPLANGFTIGVKDFMSGTLNKAPDREWAMNWILTNGGEDIIQTDVSVKFGRSEHNMALSFAAGLKEQGIEPKVEQGVNPQTFASFGRDKLAEFNESLKNGNPTEEIPFERLGLYAGRKAVIKKGK